MVCAATFGKRILKLKVIQTNGNTPDLLSCFYRNFGKYISLIPFGYGYLRILAPHQIQTIHDQLAKCLVITISGDTIKNTITYCTDSKQIGTVYWWRVKSLSGDTLTFEIMNEKKQITGGGRGIKMSN